MQLFRMSATALLEAYKRGAVSPLEAMRSVLDRVARFEPHISATYLLSPERALAEAKASEERWRRGQPIGPLDGVPATVKDNIATKGDPVPVGTAASDMTPAATDAPPAARLREAGAILFSKTTMPDNGMLSSGLSSFHKLARNPWNVARNPGGSSAGAGAAAAAGYGPLHVGTDIGGSIRLPAGWCGLIGLKPSGGRIPIEPSYYGRVAGPLTRTVEDAALMMATLTKPDARDYSSLPPQALDWRVKPLDWRGFKVGLLIEAGCGDKPTPTVRREIERAARDIAAAGAIVEPLAPFLTQEMLDGLDRFWRMRSLIDLDALSAEKRAKVLPFIRVWAEAATGLDGETVFRGFNQMREMAKAAVAATLRYDFVISPTSPDVTYPAEWAMPSNDPYNAMAHIGFTVAYNMSEQPAATVNCSYDHDGLPIGLQIIGRRFDDLGVLSAAMAFETMRASEARQWPEPPNQE